MTSLVEKKKSELSESDEFFTIGLDWMRLESEKRKLKKRILEIEETQKVMEDTYPQVSNLRGLNHSKIKINVDISSPRPLISSSSPTLNIPSPAKNSSKSSLSSPLSSLSIERESMIAKRRKTNHENQERDEKTESKETKERKDVPVSLSKSKKNRIKAKERLSKKILQDSLPPAPTEKLLLNTQDVNKVITSEDTDMRAAEKYLPQKP